MSRIDAICEAQFLFIGLEASRFDRSEPCDLEIYPQRVKLAAAFAQVPLKGAVPKARLSIELQTFFLATYSDRCHKHVNIFIRRSKICVSHRHRLSFFLISIICGVLALLPIAGIALVALPLSAFWLMAIAWGLMIIGVLFRGV